MPITNKTLETLEFDKIRKMLAEAAPTRGAAEAALALSPSDDYEIIIRRQTRTTDAKRLMEIKGMPPFGDISDISDTAGRAERGATLTTRELLNVAYLLRSTRALLDYIKTNKLFDTVLDEIFLRLSPDKPLEDKIGRAILSEEMIADEASPELSDIRRKMRGINNKIKDILQKYISGAYSKSLQENIITTRNGRYVIPVKVEYKNDIKGLIHDTSSSGATLFVEPMSVVDANNELRELEGREEAEIERVLAELSAKVGDISGTLLLNLACINELALVFACANLSYNMRATGINIVERRCVALTHARHPLLPKDTAVPINLELPDGIDTMVITGPNTGGKTVTLKTLGLLALMVQSGLHIPADETSTIGIFTDILADIGDEQSIEQSLSTFSAHMVNIVGIIDRATDGALVLFDELGAGTDPVEGAALATAILEAVRARGALCAATTHYAELKAYAIDTEGVVNASCEFDVETLRPTYRLTIGTPGKSNAFAIAGKLGLDEAIIDRAKTLINSDSRKFENVIEKLEENRIDAEKSREEAEKIRAELDEYKRKTEEELRRRLEASEREAERARKKAEELVFGAKASTDYIFDELAKLRKKGAEVTSDELDEARRALREHLADTKRKYISTAPEEKEDDDYVLPRALKKGDRVLIRSIGKEGVLVDNPDRDGRVRVQAGKIITKTEMKNLRLVTKTASESASAPKSYANTTVVRDFKYELDLRGQNGDDGWLMCDKYIDEAIVAGFKSIRIIHGKGTGMLKKRLWECFKTDSRIESFRIGQYGEGDSGVTVLELK